ncbi:aminotransferase class I/II-fold pyridoxal phosphate-dependent enzyme [Candidatus Woesearchaeota archaeon]|nr:aminotransferase class I/II-fold pyridoxal phosphate-dependent enzyme [Candidatus Woesearchaeota archaeon]
MGKVLVTGGAGYIGCVLAKKLLDKGYEVRIFDSLFFGEEPVKDMLQNPKFELVRGDLRNLEKFQGLLDGVDSVMHLASLSNDPSCEIDPQDTMDINYESSLKLAETCKKSRIRRFIFSSSCSVYGARDDLILDEQSEKAPVSLYAKSKIDFENKLLEMTDKDFSPTILRNGTVFGLSPRMRFDLVVNLMTKYAIAKNKIFIVGGGLNWRPLIHVEDVADAFILCLESPLGLVEGEIFNVGANELNFQVKDVAAIVKKTIPSVEVEYAPSDKDSRSYRVCFDKIINVLGFRAKKTVEDGVAEIAAAIRNGSLNDLESTRYVNLKKLMELRSIPSAKGGLKTRHSFLPFALPLISDDEIREVVDTLRSGWLTTGPKTKKFEDMMKEYIGCRHAIALSSCTAALHLSLVALGVKQGDEVITSPVTFPATANVIIHQGATPVFVDVDKSTLNIDPAKIEEKITSKTKAIISVDMAGQPCEYGQIRKIADKHGIPVVEDAAHSIGAEYNGKKIGTLNKATCFSFYPIKNMTTGEGGLLATDDDELASAARMYSLHGMSKDAWQRYSEKGSMHWQTVAAGYKYNMTDIQASIGMHQLKRLDEFIYKRERYVRFYKDAFSKMDEIILPSQISNIKHAWHLFVVMLDTDRLKISRDEFMELMREENIGTGIHFTSLHMHEYYKKSLGCRKEDFPNAAYLSERIVSLPLYPKMTVQDLTSTIGAVKKIINYYKKK